MISSWRDTVKLKDLPAVPPEIWSTLDTLEDLLCPPSDPDKFLFMARLLRHGKDEGLLTSREYSDLQHYLLGPRGWL